MSAWRVIITDSESPSGVAPVCPSWNDSTKHPTDGEFSQNAADPWVYDCCPHPHIQCASGQDAMMVAYALTEAEAEVCS